MRNRNPFISRHYLASFGKLPVASLSSDDDGAPDGRRAAMVSNFQLSRIVGRGRQLFAQLLNEGDIERNRR
jgi:hypothetical protein